MKATVVCEIGEFMAPARGATTNHGDGHLSEVGSGTPCGCHATLRGCHATTWPPKSEPHPPALSSLPVISDPPSPHELYEYDIAHCWWALSPGDFLSLSNGDSCQLLFAGRPGGAFGPDVRDAVLRFSTREKFCSPTFTGIPISHKQGKKLVGDVEFHIRASDWYTHQHHTDARYNNVILHVVLICDDLTPTLRQNGATIPICSLYDLQHLDDFNHLSPLPNQRPSSLATLWPCQVVIPLMSDEERARLLRHAGLLRFEQKTHAFVEQLRNAQPHAPFTAYDTCLISALAEGMGYGRDRAFFRAAGLRLLGIPNGMPEPLGRASNPSPIDARRLRILGALINQWRTHGAWKTIQEAIIQTFPTMPNHLRPYRYDNLRAIFAELSTSRTDIIICNIVLPFAAAVALIENDVELAEQARNLYLEYPGLPSNSITRAMCRQLQLDDEPRNACQQQGLHYIYAQTCQAKHCAQCIAGRSPL